MKICTEELFQPNNHSVWQATWIEATREQGAEVQRLLKTHYGFEPISPVKKVGAWEVRSHNFCVDVLRDSRQQTIVIKKNIALHDEARLTLIERILFFLDQNGIPVPKILPANTGSQHIRLDDALWQVFEFIPGNYFRGTEEELRNVAVNIARLHTALRTIPFVHEIAKMGKGTTPWSAEEFMQHIRNEATQERPAYKAILSHRSFLEERIAEIHAQEKSLQLAQQQVVRNSLHPHDTLFEHGLLRAILDFEDVGINQLARDIGNACHRFVRQYIVHQGESWEKTLPKGVRIFLDAYLKQNPLQMKELLLLPLCLTDELFRKLHSALKKLEGTDNTSPYEKEVQKFLQLLKESVKVGEELKKYTSSS